MWGKMIKASVTTAHLFYRFPILKLPPPPCAVLLVQGEIINNHGTIYWNNLQIIWLVVSTHLKNIPQIGSFPQGSGWKQRMFETTRYERKGEVGIEFFLECCWVCHGMSNFRLSSVIILMVASWAVVHVQLKRMSTAYFWALKSSHDKKNNQEIPSAKNAFTMRRQISQKFWFPCFKTPLILFFPGRLTWNPKSCRFGSDDFPDFNWVILRWV